MDFWFKLCIHYWLKRRGTVETIVVIVITACKNFFHLVELQGFQCSWISLGRVHAIRLTASLKSASSQWCCCCQDLEIQQQQIKLGDFFFISRFREAWAKPLTQLIARLALTQKCHASRICEDIDRFWFMENGEEIFWHKYWHSFMCRLAQWLNVLIWAKDRGAWVRQRSTFINRTFHLIIGRRQRLLRINTG